MIKTIHSKCSIKFEEFFAVEENFNVILKTHFQTSNFEINFFFNSSIWYKGLYDLSIIL